MDNQWKYEDRGKTTEKRHVCSTGFPKIPCCNSNGKACMTPFMFMSYGNYVQKFPPAFIVVVRNKYDIKHTVKFARNHSLGLAIMGTGHDDQDRNAGAGKNSLLIRTVCLQNWTANPTSSKTTGQGIWIEGFATAEAGLTWGQNFWGNVITSGKSKYKGLYELADDVKRFVVGGTCHSVWLVGYTLGGGRGPTSAIYGLASDQVISFECDVREQFDCE